MKQFARIVVAGFTSLLILAPAAFSADLEKAERLLERKHREAALKELIPLAEAGNVQAQYLAGSVYDHFYWQGKRELAKKAEFWFGQAAASGHLSAKAHLGAVLQYSPTTPEREARGRRLIKEASDAGDPIGQFLQGFVLAHPPNATTEQRRQGFRLLERSAVQSYGPAYAVLIQLHLIRAKTRKESRKARNAYIESMKWMVIQLALKGFHNPHQSKAVPKELRADPKAKALAYARAVAWLRKYRPEKANSLPVKPPWAPPS